VNVEPTPGVLCTRMSPPCASDDRLRDEEPEAGALGALRLADAPVLLEEMRDLVGRDAAPVSLNATATLLFSVRSRS
jgi:hypothetical protein